MDAAELLAALGGKHALLREMARLCLEVDGPRLRAGLRAAVEAGDHSAVEYTAHALKGLAGEFRAHAARAAAACLEEAAHSGKPGDYRAALAEFEQEYEKLAAVLRVVVQSPAA